MAVTTVNLFLEEKGTSFIGVGLDSGSYVIPVANAELDGLISMDMDAGTAGISGSFFENEAISISLEGDAVVVNTISGSAEVVKVSMDGAIYTSNELSGELPALSVTMEAGGYIVSSGSLDKTAVLVSAEGSIVRSTDDVIPLPADEEYPYISGEEYIVVNLKTKAHSTYRDGERTAVATTGKLSFGSITQKTVSDAYLGARARGAMSVITNTGENKPREYQVTYGETLEPNLRSKVVPLAKGIRSNNWEFSIVVPDESHLEVRSIELNVTNLKRHR